MGALDSRYSDYGKTATVVVHPVNDAEEYVKLVGDINPVHYEDGASIQAYELLTSNINEKRGGDFLRGRQTMSDKRPNRRLIQGLYIANVSTLDLIPAELRSNVIGHTCTFVNPWLNSGDGETLVTNVSYKRTYLAHIGGSDVPIHAFEVGKSIRGIPEWYLRKAFYFLGENALKRKIGEGQDIDLIANGYIFASEQPLDFSGVSTIERPYDRRTRIAIDNELFLKSLLNEKQVRKLPYVKRALDDVRTKRNCRSTLVELLNEIVMDSEKLEETTGDTIIVKSFDFEQSDFERYNKLLKLDPLASISFDYFESRLPGVALEIAARRGIFDESFLVYSSQNFKSNRLVLDKVPKKFSIVALYGGPMDHQYNLHCAIILDEELLGVGTLSGVLMR